MEHTVEPSLINLGSAATELVLHQIPLLVSLNMVVVLVGIAGKVLPALPGTPLVLIGLILAAWADGFQKVGWFPLAVIAGLTVLSLLVDFAATSLGAKRVNSSRPRWVRVGPMRP